MAVLPPSFHVVPCVFNSGHFSGTWWHLIVLSVASSRVFTMALPLWNLFKFPPTPFFSKLRYHFASTGLFVIAYTVLLFNVYDAIPAFCSAPSCGLVVLFEGQEHDILIKFDTHLFSMIV